MEGKVALEEHSSAELNNSFWDAARCVAEINRSGVERFIMSLISPGVQSVTDTGKAIEKGSVAKRCPSRYVANYST